MLPSQLLSMALYVMRINVLTSIEHIRLLLVHNTQKIIFSLFVEMIHTCYYFL